MNFWKNMLSYYSVTYTNLAQLVKIIVSVSGGTNLLGRSYIKLAKLCYEDTKKLTVDHTEAWYLLRSMNFITKKLVFL